MMTTMSTPQSGDISAGQYRLAQVSRLIRSAQSLAEKIAELTEDELARICNERGDVVPGAVCFYHAAKRRSAADVLAIEGEKSSTMLAAMVRTVWLYENRPELNWSGGAARH